MPVTAAAVGISAAVSAYGAHKAANASEAAAKTQSDSGQKALDLAREQWQQSQANQQPYINTGYGALMQLANRTQQPRPQMPMFNGQMPGGGWTPQNFAQQAPPPFMNQGGPLPPRVMPQQPQDQSLRQVIRAGRGPAQ